jgi:hypothetical protein
MGNTLGGAASAIGTKGAASLEVEVARPNGDEIKLVIEGSNVVKDLKDRIATLTGVPPASQQLYAQDEPGCEDGLDNGRRVDDITRGTYLRGLSATL